MVKEIFGDRIGKQGKVSVACSAIIFDSERAKVLLTRRSDNGRWCLPGGHMEAGESASEACIREIQEETGLDIRIEKLIGIYTTPHVLMEYADGNRWHRVGLCFEAAVTGGTLRSSDETTDQGFYSPSEFAAMDVLETHRHRIADAFAAHPTTFIR